MLPLCWQALIFGLFSALSLPVGAILGVSLAPVSAKVTARWMAFGSGALVFAVATQLFGEALFRLFFSSMGDGCGRICQDHFKNLAVQILCAMLGALLYVGLNRLLEHVAAQGQGQPAIPSVGSQRSPSVIEPGQTASFLEMQSSPIAALGAFRRASTAGREAGAHEEARISGSAEERSNGHDHGNVALSMWLGMMLDGIPEALMLGFMTNEGGVTFSFLVAIFIANFPEAFSGASILLGQNMPVNKILAMWTVLFLLTGLLAMVGSLIMPEDVKRGSSLETIRDISTSAMEGITGGAMLAMVSTAMLPEAFKGAGERAGVLFVLGFGLSVWITAIGYRYGNPQPRGPREHAFVE